MNIFVKSTVAIAALSATLACEITIGQAIEYQPHMQNALNSLVAARDELALSATNKHGHRVEALRLTNLAIAEVRLGMVEAN